MSSKLLKLRNYIARENKLIIGDYKNMIDLKITHDCLHLQMICFVSSPL